MNKPKVTVTFERQVIDDDSYPDLSYLEQDYKDVVDEAEREKYKAQNAERLAAYNRGEWHMIGIRAKATVWVERVNYRTSYELESPGIWGIESDSGEEYFRETFSGECDMLREDIKYFGNAEFKS